MLYKIFKAIVMALTFAIVYALEFSAVLILIGLGVILNLIPALTIVETVIIFALVSLGKWLFCIFEGFVVSVFVNKKED